MFNFIMAVIYCFCFFNLKVRNYKGHMLSEKLCKCNSVMNFKSKRVFIFHIC